MKFGKNIIGINIMKSRFSDHIKRIEQAKEQEKELSEKFHRVFRDTRRIIDMGINMGDIVEEIEKEFKEKSKLTSVDLSILMLAIGLQVARQQLQKNYFTDDSRPTDSEAAGNKEYNRDERKSGYYKTSIEEILTNPVPFDTQNGTAAKEINLGGGNGHRNATLGHDPILGLFFGTANIATRTVTLTNPFLKSYHVKYGNFKTKLGELSRNKGDYFAEQADVSKIIKYSWWDNLKGENGVEGYSLLLVALGKEIMHLKSDALSKKSLSIPFTALNKDIVDKLAKYNIDMGLIYTVGKQMSMSILINSLIRLLHQLIITHTEKDVDLDILEVRTRKILSYSNATASTINIAEVGIRFGIFKDASAINKLDIGGFLVTIFRLISDYRYINEVKEKYINEKWDKLLDDEEYWYIEKTKQKKIREKAREYGL